MKRRHVLGWLGGVGLLTVGTGGRTVEGYLQALAPAAADDRRQRALKVVRYLNTALAAHHAKTGHYTDLNGLRLSPVLALHADHPYTVLIKAGKFSELAPHFSITVSLKPDNQGYDLAVSEEEGSFKYLTDEKGVIKTVGDTEAGDPRTPRPIQDVSGIGRRKGGRVLGAVAAIAAFFVPALSASPNPCGDCFTCQPTCGGCAPEIGGCCNWGTQTCPWCCKRWASCICPE